MNEALKQFSAELAKEVTAAIATKENKEIIEKTLAADDSGSFEVVVSTADIDRGGDVVRQDGWDLANYKANPIVLYGHDYYSLPIGVCDSIEVKGGKLVAKGRFAPADANPFAQQVRKLYDLKMLRTTSVGFIVKETNGKEITKAELLEFSFVPVPANPYALSMREVNENVIDVAMLQAKGLNLEVKDVENEVAPVEEEVIEETPAEVISEETPIETETVETTKEEEIKETEIEEKGLIADTLNADGKWYEKWDNLDKISNIIETFYQVYLNKLTPLEDFNVLVAELGQLLIDFAANTDSESVKTYCAKHVDKQEFVAKAGKRLSGKSIEVLSGINTNLKELAGQLDNFLTDEQKASEEDEAATDKTIKRSKAAGSEKLLKGLNDYLTVREVLRSVDNAIGGALENVNKTIREKSQKK